MFSWHLDDHLDDAREPSNSFDWQQNVLCFVGVQIDELQQILHHILSS